MMRVLYLTLLAGFSLPLLISAQAANPLATDIDRAAQETMPLVVAWRRDFHQHPELGNSEVRTAKVIADQLRKLGYEVTTGVAKTGVVAVLKGAKPGPVVALRSDIGAQIVNALQTIVSRNVNIAEAPAVVTVATFHGGNRFNIVPEEAELGGTIRAFGEEARKDIRRRLELISKNIAEAAGGSAEISYSLGYPVTINDPRLTNRMVPTLTRVAGADNVRVAPLTGTAEDFSYFGQKVPSMFVFLGVTPRDQDWTKVPVNHSPLFFADESALPVGEEQ